MARQVIDAGSVSSNALEDLRLKLEEQRNAAAKIAEAAAADIENIQAELDALGLAPDAGQTEAPEASAIRAEVTSRMNAARAEQGRAQRAVAQTRNLLSDLASLGQRNFIQRLENRSPSPLLPCDLDCGEQCCQQPCRASVARGSAQHYGRRDARRVRTARAGCSADAHHRSFRHVRPSRISLAGFDPRRARRIRTQQPPDAGRRPDSRPGSADRLRRGADPFRRRLAWRVRSCWRCAVAGRRARHRHNHHRLCNGCGACSRPKQRVCACSN